MESADGARPVKQGWQGRDGGVAVGQGKRRNRKTGRRGTYLEDLTWDEAEPILRADPVVVIPIGAAAKEHGRHLPLGTDHIMADYLAERLAERLDVLIMPTVTIGRRGPDPVALDSITLGPPRA